jgi:thiamine-phosphate pyrophosphorylase
VIVLPRLYAILDIDVTAAKGLHPLTIVDAWLAAGVRIVQLRAKHLTGGPMFDLAVRVGARCRAAGAMFIVNDRADVARLAEADGVHVGQTDLTPPDARRVVGDAAVVGVSTHNDAQMREAMAWPVDYVAIGPVFATSSKHQPDPVVGLDGVRRARIIADERGLPLVAIGGITAERAPDVIGAGATAVALISDLLKGDPGDRARQYLDALR